MMDQVKQEVGERAAQFVEDGMLIGLGTGSTAKYLIEALIERVKKEHLNIEVVATSKESEMLAKEGGLKFRDINQITKIDLTLDGADEIDLKNFSLIKGGGGALTREKIVADMSEKMIVLVDETKLVDRLGAQWKLPVEIVAFGRDSIKHKLEKLGYFGSYRQKEDELFFTDNGGVILDIEIPSDKKPETMHEEIKKVTGVIETGFFFDLATTAIVGYTNGDVKVFDKPS